MNAPLLHMSGIDKAFGGTAALRSAELVIGRGEVHAVIGQNGAGLIATHDLELIKLADDFPDIANCHFREEVAAGKMVFDYKLHPGPCPTTNALKIMRVTGQ